MFNPESDIHAYEENPPGRDHIDGDKKPADGKDVADTKKSEKSPEDIKAEAEKNQKFKTELQGAETQAQKMDPPPSDAELRAMFADFPPKAVEAE